MFAYEVLIAVLAFCALVAVTAAAIGGFAWLFFCMAHAQAEDDPWPSFDDES